MPVVKVIFPCVLWVGMRLQKRVAHASAWLWGEGGLWSKGDWSYSLLTWLAVALACLPSFLPWLLRLSRRDCHSSFRFPSRAFARFVREEFGRVQRGGERRGWLVPLVSADRADSPASLSASPPTRACVRAGRGSLGSAPPRPEPGRLCPGCWRGADGARRGGAGGVPLGSPSLPVGQVTCIPSCPRSRWLVCSFRV